MGTPLTDQLKSRHAATWSSVVGHQFVRELAASSINDKVMANYLIQDYRFFEGFLGLIGAAIAQADTLAAKLTFGRFAGSISSDENTYFTRALAALGIDERQLNQPPDTPATAGFKAIMHEAAGSGSYAAILSVLNVAEGSYLEWASAIADPLPENFIHAEWIILHNNPEFTAFVQFLRRELDRVGPEHEALCEDIFRRAIALEKDFFDSVYQLVTGD